MPKYLLHANYTKEGAQGLAREGGSRRAATVGALVESVGGRMEAFYYAFGDVDAYVIVDVPDEVTAAAMALAVNASGAVTLRTTALLTPEQVDQAVQKTVGYRAPGQ
jgi:uncharacterized protein with GYD domain